MLALAANGLVDKEIALKMNVRVSTIRTYWDRVRFKLQVQNRTHAVCVAVALGLVSVSWARPDIPAGVLDEYTAQATDKTETVLGY